MPDKYEPNARAVTKTILLGRPTFIVCYTLYALEFVTRKLSMLAAQLT